MPKSISDLASDVTAAPIGDLISSVGESVAEAQAALDAGSLQATLDLYSEGGSEMVEAMRAIGYRPTFYALPETTGEITVALRMGQTTTEAPAAPKPAQPVVPSAVSSRFGSVQLGTVNTQRLAKTRVYATPVDGGYANRFNFQSDLRAKVSFKIVPVPAPQGAENIRRVPDLTGRNLAAVRTVADVLGFTLRFLDAENGDAPLEPAEDYLGVVVSQDPPADGYAETGGTLTVAMGVPS
ncbi:MAG: hypothetical protein AAGF71_01420 [Pseudomonadota bacterium]